MRNLVCKIECRNINGCYAEQAPQMHSSPFSSGWAQFMPAQFAQQRPSSEAVFLLSCLVRRKTASGMAAAWLAAAGSNLSGPCFLDAGSNLCSSSPLFPEGRPLFPEAGSNVYRRNFCYAKQAPHMHSSPLFLGLEATYAGA